MVVRDLEDGLGHFLYIKKGMTQRYPLAMITYSIRVLPIIKELRYTHPCVAQPWYADDAGTRGGIRANPITLPGPADSGATAGLILGINQEYLGCSPAERGKG